MAIDRERRIRFVAGKHLIDRVTRDLQRGIVERTFGKHRRVAGGVQQHIAVAQRHVESLGEVQHHVAARSRAPGLQKAEMARGDFRVQRQIELAQAATLPPFAQQIADGPHRDCSWRDDNAVRARDSNYLRCNRPALPMSTKCGRRAPHRGATAKENQP